METNNFSQLLSLLLVFSLLAVGMVFAAISSEPSKPTSITELGNVTNSYPNATALNGTRGYIYELIINESQPTQKWVAYVGNVIGKYALQDPNANAVYDWNIITVTGELYATKEGPFVTGACEQGIGGSCTGGLNPFAGGIPYWPNLTCANNVSSVFGSAMITREEKMFNHTASDEDSYSNTFKSTGFTLPTFYAGETRVSDSGYMWNGSAGNCYGVNLMRNNTKFASDTGKNWTEVILTDGTFQYVDSTLADQNYDLIYGVLLENDSFGYNGTKYDFQVLLPQSGLSGTQSNVAYYFYIELV